MATFSQQYGQLGQQANPAISDATQNKNPGGFPNVAPNMRAKPMQMQPTPAMVSNPGQLASERGGGFQGMMPMPNYGGPRTAPSIDPRQFWGNQGPRNGNMPGVGGPGGVQPGAFGRIEKGAWNDPNNFRGAGGPRGPMGFSGGGLPRPPMGPPGKGPGGLSVSPAGIGWSGGYDTMPTELRQLFGNPMQMDNFRTAQPQGPRFPGDPNGPRSGGPMAPPQQPGGPTVNRPQQPMAPPNNGGGITANGPGMAGGGK